MAEQTEREAQLLEEAHWREQKLMDELANERRHLRTAVGETPSYPRKSKTLCVISPACRLQLAKIRR